MRVEELEAYGIPSVLIRVWRDKGILELTEIQEATFTHPDFLGDRNLLIVAPTSSGKTFVGEVASVVTALQLRRAVYLVPMKALAEEKYTYFHDAYSDPAIGLQVVISSGDHTEFDPDIISGNFSLAVVVYEKFMQLLVQAPGLIRMCGLIVVDELQLIRDKSRGPKLEMLLTRILITPDAPRLIGLSATIRALNGLDSWLSASAIISGNRPVPLLEGISDLTGAITYYQPDGQPFQQEIIPIQPPCETTDQLIYQLVQSFTPKWQLLIFVSAKDDTRTLAESIARLLPVLKVSTNTFNDAELLEDTNFKAFLQQAGLSHGVGYHNADLSPDERLLAERLFREGALRVLISTTTLAMGVNLPTDLVIVRDVKRWDQRAKVAIPVAEYKNAAGRAGRLGSRQEGKSLLLAESKFEIEQLRRNFIIAQPEPIDSAIPMAGDFPCDVLSLIASQLAQTASQVEQAFRASFAFVRFYNLYSDQLSSAIIQAIDDCLDLGLIAKEGGILKPTSLGLLVAQSGVSFPSYKCIVGAIESICQTGYSAPDVIFHILQAKELSAAAPYLRPDERDIDRFRPQIKARTDIPPESVLGKLLAQPQLPSRDDDTLIKRALLLAGWVECTKIRDLEATFRVGYGAIRALAETMSWLIDTTAKAARLKPLDKNVVAHLERLAGELKFGVPHELLEIAKLRARGVGRDALLRLVLNDRGIQITSVDALFDYPDEHFRGVIGPRQLLALREASIAQIRDTTSRCRRGQTLRLQRAGANSEVVEHAYEAQGIDFERALTDLLQAPPLSLDCARVPRQLRGEADIHLVHSDGLIVIQATSSQEPTGRVRWDKCREVLGQGVGLDPVAFVVVGKPDFHSLAVDNAKAISGESGRRILLVPFHVIAEMSVRVAEGKLNRHHLVDLLRRETGYFDMSALMQATPEER